MNISQQYAKSLGSSDLSDNEQSQSHNTDALAAVSLGADEFGAALLRIKYSSTRNEPNALAVRLLLHDWRIKVRKKAKIRGWDVSSDSVAHQSFWFWLYDTCVTCNGRKHGVIDQTPMLEVLVCPTCDGTGIKPYDFLPDVREYVIDAVVALRKYEAIARSGADLKLGK
jgi:hypothetical protein